MKRVLMAMMGLVVALAGMLVAPTEKLYAAPTPGEHLTGTDPQATGCANDARTIYSRPLNDFDTPSVSYGTIELRYSPTCRTAWARVILNFPSDGTGRQSVGERYGSAEIDRNDNQNVTFTCAVPKGQYSCYTKQINDAGYTSFAIGRVWETFINQNGQMSAYMIASEITPSY
jgi:hypothetical protein